MMSHSLYTQPCVLDHYRWIKDHSIQISTYPAFVSEYSLTEYLECDTLKVLQEILILFFPDGDAIRYAKRVAREYPRVFSILLEIEKLEYLETFLNDRGLNDAHLPFESLPTKFPVVLKHPHFFSEFCDKQWRYCPTHLKDLVSIVLNDKEPLPITDKILRGAGANSKVYEIKVAPRYNSFMPTVSIQTETETFALKEFIGKGAEKAWRREFTTFKRLQQGTTTSTNIIRCHYAFKHKETYGIILEYADIGSLEKYLQETEPPVDPRDVIAFLEGFMALLQGLKALHGGRHRIWHQDIKPANILVLSNPRIKSPYHCRFKIGDLSTSHSRQRDPSDDDHTDHDTQGTKTYGAPKCYRPDSLLGKGDIRVEQKVDHWSLGCVLSEILIWLVMGIHGINEYRKDRTVAINYLAGRNPGDYFHDGMEMLPVVSTWHEVVKYHSRNKDGILSGVIPLIEGMLTVSEDRKDAPFYCTQAHTIIRTMKESLLETETNQSMKFPRDVPLPRFPRIELERLGSPSPSRASTIGKRRPTTMEPVQFPSRSAYTPKRKSVSNSGVPPYLSFEEAMRWYMEQKDSKGTRFSPRDSWAVDYLEDRDMVFIIDDSESMREHWPRVSSLFRILAYMLKSKDKNGLDLYFTSSLERFHHRHTSPLIDKVEKQGNRLNRGYSDMSNILEEILGDHERAIERASRIGQSQKALNIYVFTDGKWNPQCNIVPSIDSIVQVMQNRRVPEKNVGLQFISFGNYQEGLKKLRLVDNYLELPLDIVDTTRSTGNIYKMLCGACNRWFDGTEIELGHVEEPSRTSTPTIALEISDQSESGDSDLSDENSSAFSAPLSVQSTVTSASGMTGINLLLIQEFAALLYRDRTLSSLISSAMSKPGLGFRKTQHKLRHLLKAYAEDLKVEMSSEHHRALVGFISVYSNKISIEILFKISMTDNGARAEPTKNLHNAEERRKKVEEYLEKTFDPIGSTDLGDTNNSNRSQSVEERNENSDSDEDSVQNSAAESGGEGDSYDGSLMHLDQMKRFILGSVAYQTLHLRLADLVQPSLESRLRDLVTAWSKLDHKYHVYVTQYKLSNLVAELQYIRPHEIAFDQGKQNASRLLSVVSYYQNTIERWTGERWDWWPLAPSSRPLAQLETRVRWKCTCGEERSTEVPSPFAKRLKSIIRNLPQSSHLIHNGRSQPILDLQNSNVRDTHENSNVAGQSGQNGQGAQLLRGSSSVDALRNLQSRVKTLDTDVNLSSYRILFMVKRNAEYKLAQICIGGLNSHTFFSALRDNYFHLRGLLRAWFSVWRYSHCDFYMFEKFEDHEYAPKHKDTFPEETNPDYEYHPKPMESIPPVSEHEFKKRFYACHQQQSLLHWHYRCKTIVFQSYDLLKLFPKKKTEFEEGGDKREDFWGIYAREIISLRWVLLYNLICVTPMLAFFLVWVLRLGQSTDLQNASVPTSIMVAMLSLFWSVFLSSLQFGRPH